MTPRRSFAAFEYSITSESSTTVLDPDAPGSSSSSSTSDYAAVSIALPSQCPDLRLDIKRPIPSDRIRFLKRFETPDLVFGDPEFDDRFRVVTNTPGFARAILTPQVMRQVVADLRFTSWELGVRYAHLYTKGGARLNPEEIVPKLDFLCDFLDRTPAFVWDAARPS